MFDTEARRADAPGRAPGAAAGARLAAGNPAVEGGSDRAADAGPYGARPGLVTGVVAMVEAVETLERDAGAAAGIGSQERRSVIAGVDGAIARLTAVRARLLVAERDSGAWRAGGAASFAQARGVSSGAGQGAAIREERQADALVGLSAVGDAARSGVIGLGHVDVIAQVAADRSESVRNAVASAEGQAELVELAKTQDAPAFGRAVQRWAAGHDSEALESSHQAQRRARYLNLSATDAGTRVKGLLDAQSGHRLRLALESVSPRPAADDDRSSEQRAADALITLAEAALADPTTAPGAAVRPHVSYLMREQTFIALRRRRATPAGDGLGASTGPAPATPGDTADQATTAGCSAGDPPLVAGHSAGGSPSAPGHDSGDRGAATGRGADQDMRVGADALLLLEDGTPVPRSEAERALCDCEITRIVVDADDVPMNLGRTQRLYAGVHRRAVIARDRSCRWAGCSMPARWCEIHHIRWWDRDNGDTSVTNAVLLCALHHHETHRRNLDVTRLPPPPSGPRRRRRHGARPGDPHADEPGPGLAPEHENQGGNTNARTRQSDSDRALSRLEDHHDGSGGTRYRFIDTTGRVIAGPSWNENASPPGGVLARAELPSVGRSVGSDVIPDAPDQTTSPRGPEASPAGPRGQGRSEVRRAGEGSRGLEVAVRSRGAEPPDESATSERPGPTGTRGSPHCRSAVADQVEGQEMLDLGGPGS